MDTTSVNEELARLRAEVAELRQEVRRDGAGDDEAESKPISRRKLLTLGGAVAAGAAAAVLPAKQAAAVPPDSEIWQLQNANSSFDTVGLDSQSNLGVDLRRARDFDTQIPAGGTGLHVEGAGPESVAIDAVQLTNGTAIRGVGQGPGHAGVHGANTTGSGSVGVLGQGVLAGVAGLVGSASTLTGSQGCVTGASGNANAVVGTSDQATGVTGITNSGFALIGAFLTPPASPGGQNTLGGPGKAHLLLVGGGTTPPSGPTVDQLKGAFYLTSDQSLMHNKVDGGPSFGGSSSVFVRVGYTALAAPFRLVDTRIGLGGGIFTAQERRAFDVAPSGTTPNNVPVAAAVHAVTLNVTAVGGSTIGYATVLANNAPAIPSGGDATYSNINWSTGQVQANQATVKVHTNGKFDVFNRDGTVHIIVDVIGYFS